MPNRDRLRAVANWPVVGKILDNDIDPDGDKLKIISVTSSTKNDGSVIKNKNDTVTFLPATNFVGIDSFSYTVSDGKGETDKAKVSLSIKQEFVRTMDQSNHESSTIEGEGGRNGQED